MLKKVFELQEGDIIIAEDNGDLLEIKSITKGPTRDSVHIDFKNDEYAVIPENFSVEISSSDKLSPKSRD